MTCSLSFVVHIFFLLPFLYPYDLGLVPKSMHCAIQKTIQHRQPFPNGEAAMKLILWA
jgi:hypothetical protein